MGAAKEYLKKLAVERDTDKLIQEKKTPIAKTNSGDGLFIPNHSGQHTAGTTGTPVDDLDIANKGYVDSQISGENHWDDTGTTLEPYHAGRNILTTGNVQGVTQAEFNTLTNDSMADALHRHSELSASDGSPNPALSVDASGNVGIGLLEM